MLTFCADRFYCALRWMEYYQEFWHSTIWGVSMACCKRWTGHCVRKQEDREKPVLSVCRYQSARGPERTDTWGQLICYTECLRRLTPWSLDSTTLASSLLTRFSGFGPQTSSHSIQLDLLCLSWDFLAAIINPLINPHLLCLYTQFCLYGGTWLSHLPVLLANCVFTSKCDSYSLLWQPKSMCFHFKASLCD